MRTLTTLLAAAVLAVAPLGAPSATAVAAADAPLPSAPLSPDDVSGTGWVSFAACTTCVAGGVGLLISGKAALLLAVWAEGSTIALGACVAACKMAIE